MKLQRVIKAPIYFENISPVQTLNEAHPDLVYKFDEVTVESDQTSNSKSRIKKYICRAREKSISNQ